ncbi:hypothetical protein [Nocardiopsis sp. JB363]|uniref:hypothetical protein n=1 Tax=Nocardiopsis sp. JB363 TaxID=1434837 RepID=UPI000979C96F|nr:hypothetical protein [Nocardiopsis sp. JB363]SIO91372.1 hypothetical protein BQ8420_31400 [Nocardiopsis sp. JB363]
MATNPETVHELRTKLRADLVIAMKARRSEVVSALRTAIAALDNAEAVAAPDTSVESVSEHVAGVGAGVGSTERERRALSVEEVRKLLRSQVEERVVEAERYESLGRSDAAQRLRVEADALRKYL